MPILHLNSVNLFNHYALATIWPAPVKVFLIKNRDIAVSNT